MSTFVTLQTSAIPIKGQTCAAEGDWTDLWGNKVDIQEFVDQGLMSAPDNGAGDPNPAGHDCIEGHASTLLQDQNCNNNMHYACIPKWRGVDGALAPGTTPGMELKSDEHKLRVVGQTLAKCRSYVSMIFEIYYKAAVHLLRH